MKRISCILYGVIILLLQAGVDLHAQTVERIDSLKTVLTTPQHDTARALTLLEICRYYQNNDLDSLTKYSKACIVVSDEAEYSKGQGNGHIMLGIALMYEGNNAAALQEYETAYSYYTEIGLRKGMANSLNNIALIYSATGQYDLALDNQLRAMELYKADGNWRMHGNSLNNIGLIYLNQQRFEEAFPYLIESVRVMKDSGEVPGLRNPYNNLGLVYKSRNNFDSAAYYFKLAIDLYQEASDDHNLAGCYNNLALNYELQKDSANALLYHRKALDIRRTSGDIPGLTTSWLNIGIIYEQFHLPDVAKPYIHRAIHLADSLKMYEVLFQGYRELALIDSSKGNMDSAFYYLKIAMEYRDSMVSEETDQRLADMRIKYDTDQIKQQSALKDEQLKTEKTIRWLIMGIGVLVFFGLVIVAFALRAVRRKNKLLATQKLEILQKNAVMTEKNLIISNQKQQITDSINYANTIQTALLPSEKELLRDLPGAFVFFEPRDIISGDFYFVAKTGDGVLFAVADCTGHGVPGAMMSMLGVEELQKAIAVSPDPGKILIEVNRSIRNLLRQSAEGGTSRDGMDIAFCYLQGNTLRYAGAQRPLWICRNNELIEYKGTKMAIGGITPDDQVFVTHSIALQSGDMIYLSSDGYADQFGGETGKKMMTKNMKMLLSRIAHESTEVQRSKISEAFTTWKGKREQVDDVCVMGVRIN